MTRLSYILMMVMAIAVLAYIVSVSGALDYRLVLIAVAATGLAGIWILVAGLNLRRFVALLMVLLIFAPGIRLSHNLPVIFGDEILIFALGGLALSQFANKNIGSVGTLLALFIPMTALSIFIGYIVFDIFPTKGDLFEFVKIAKYVLAFYIASRVSIRHGDLKFLSTLIVVLVSISAIIGLVQVFNVPGAREFFANVYFGAFQSSGSALADPNTVTAITTRAAGTIGNPNGFGLILGVGLVFGLSLLLSRAFQRRVMTALIVCNALMLITLVLTGSRTATIAVIVIGAYLGVVFLVRRQRIFEDSVLTSRKIRLFLFAIPVLLAFAFIDFGEGVPDIGDAISSRYQRTITVNLQGKPIQARIYGIRVGLSQAVHSPIFGYGPAEGSEDLIHSSGMDNEIIFVLLRYGVVGLLLYVAFWVTSFRLARSLQYLRSQEAFMFGNAVAAVVILNMVATWTAISFFDIRRMTLTCILLGLCVAVRSGFRSSDTAQQELPNRAHGTM